MMRRTAPSLRHSPLREQHGMVLITSLVMLVLLILFVIAGIRLSNINLQIVGNYQWQRTMEMVTDAALEQVISQVANFSVTATARDVCQDGNIVTVGTCTIANPKIGSVTAPVCTRSATATGYSKKLGELAPDDNVWILTANATDSVTGAVVRIHRGITIRQLSGNCPA